MSSPFYLLRQRVRHVLAVLFIGVASVQAHEPLPDKFDLDAFYTNAWRQMAKEFGPYDRYDDSPATAVRWAKLRDRYVAGLEAQIDRLDKNKDPEAIDDLRMEIKRSRGDYFYFRGVIEKLTRDPVPEKPAAIELAKSWESPLSGGSATIKDLQTVLDGKASATTENLPHPNLLIYKNVSFLMPLADAAALLKLDSLHSTAQQKVACPGLPKDTFYYTSFDTTSDPPFNRIYLVTDVRSRVVSVQLVDEHPEEMPELKWEEDFITYNFINCRRKGSPLVLAGWRAPSVAESSAGKAHAFEVLCIDTGLIRKKDRKPLERCRWYLPTGVAGLILHCCQLNAVKDN